MLYIVYLVNICAKQPTCRLLTHVHALSKRQTAAHFFQDKTKRLFRQARLRHQQSERGGVSSRRSLAVNLKPLL